jgi:hypothetical protein
MYFLKLLKYPLFILAVTSSYGAMADSIQIWIRSVPATLLDGTAWVDAATEHDLDPWLLYAITLEESGTLDSNGKILRPWPYQLHIKGKTLRFNSQKEAAQQIEQWEKAGIRNYDIGPLQINRRWHGHRVEHPSDLLNVSRSLHLAAYLLAETLQLSGSDKELGIGRYRSRHEDEARAYARRIQDIRVQLPEYSNAVIN